MFITTSCASFAVALVDADVEEEELVDVLVPDVADREGLLVALMLEGVVGFEAEVEEYDFSGESVWMLEEAAVEGLMEALLRFGAIGRDVRCGVRRSRSRLSMWYCGFDVCLSYLLKYRIDRLVRREGCGYPEGSLLMFQLMCFRLA